MAAAVSSIWVRGRKARRTPYQAVTAQASITAAPMRMAQLRMSRTEVSTLLSDTATA